MPCGHQHPGIGARLTGGRYNQTVTAAAKEEITISRVFDASAELVYRAFVDPDQLCLWFGPDGFSVPCESVQIDARPGGFQRFMLVSDADPAMRSRVDATFTEVVENELLAGRQEIEGAPGNGVLLRLEFHQEAPDRTRLDLRQGPFTEDHGEVTITGWESSFVRLDALLRRSL
jgi:uncharacterized protein YndB with AHSA1/START domain